MEKENWIKQFNKKYPSSFDKKLDFIDEFKENVFKKYKPKKDKSSERWAY